MKTELALNIDDKVVEKAKKFSSGKNISLSFFGENYLSGLLQKSTSQKKESPKRPTITQRIRKFTRPIKTSEKESKKQ